MRIAVIGVGGIGGPYGASLAKAGVDVTFVARGAHLAAMRENGLRIEGDRGEILVRPAQATEDRKSTRLNSSHEWISYAVFCLKKKNHCANGVTKRLALDLGVRDADLLLPLDRHGECIRFGRCWLKPLTRESR